MLHAWSSLSSLPLLPEWLTAFRDTWNIPSLLAFNVFLGALQRINVIRLSLGMSSGLTLLKDSAFIVLPTTFCFPTGQSSC